MRLRRTQPSSDLHFIPCDMRRSLPTSRQPQPAKPAATSTRPAPFRRTTDAIRDTDTPLAFVTLCSHIPCLLSPHAQLVSSFPASFRADRVLMSFIGSLAPLSVLASSQLASSSSSSSQMSSSGAKKSHIGLIGLAVMGQNLALNIADKGFDISVYNRTYAKTTDTERRAVEEKVKGKLTGYEKIEDFVQSLQTPRAIIFLVMAGKPVDDVIAQLVPLLDKGDLIIDGGNEWSANPPTTQSIPHSRIAHAIADGAIAAVCVCLSGTRTRSVAPPVWARRAFTIWAWECPEARRALATVRR